MTHLLSTLDRARAHTNTRERVTYGMAQTEAEAEVMAKTAAKFEEVNNSLQSMLTSLMSQLEVLHTAWQGQGARSFHHVKNQWVGDQKAMARALSETASAIRVSGTSYTASDSESAGRVSRTSHSINLPL